MVTRALNPVAMRTTRKKSEGDYQSSTRRSEVRLAIDVQRRAAPGELAGIDPQSREVALRAVRGHKQVAADEAKVMRPVAERVGGDTARSLPSSRGVSLLALGSCCPIPTRAGAALWRRSVYRRLA